MTPSLSVVSAHTDRATTFDGDRHRNCELGFVAPRSSPRAAPLRRVLAAEL